MERKKIEIIAVAMLLVIFALVLLGSIKPKGRPNKSQTAAGYGPGKVEPLFKNKAQEVKKEEPFMEWGRDPFVREEAVTLRMDTVSNLKLMGIISGEGKKARAIINDRMVSVGSKIGKFTVIRISATSVILKDGEKNIELNIQ